jgi:hypothetical protein
MDAIKSFGRVGILAVAAMAAAGCAEETPSVDSSSEDVEERKGRQVEAVDPFAAGLCTGEGISIEGLQERFGASSFELSLQVAMRSRECTDAGCGDWSQNAIGVVTGRAQVQGTEDPRLVLLTDFGAEWTDTAQDGSEVVRWWQTSMAIGLDNEGSGLEQVTAYFADRVGTVDGGTAPIELQAESVETSFDTTCFRTLATLPVSGDEGSMPAGTQVEYGIYASVEVEPFAAIAITEIDYAQSGKDDREFIELKNVGTAAADLRGIDLELVDGRDDEPYFVVALDRDGAMLEAGKTLVIGAAALQGNVGDARFMRLRSALQDGPDSVRLVGNFDGERVVLDEIRYGNGAEQTGEGTLRPALIDDGRESICRGDAGVELCQTPSPGR